MIWSFVIARFARSGIFVLHLDTAQSVPPPRSLAGFVIGFRVSPWFR